jgi:glycosyltransferase involved in cell wall biosynthesis
MLTLSVIVCTYSSKRWSLLQESMSALRVQTRAPDEVILVVDHNDELAARARDAFPELCVVSNREERGLSGARNTGVAEATGDVVVFVDDDAVPDPDWLEVLSAAYASPSVAGAGGEATPRPELELPRWFPREFNWVIGCSYEGLPRSTSPVRNPLGANMSFRRASLRLIDGFRSGIGRVGTKPLGCEETELSIRIHDATGGSILYVPEARVRHFVPASRTTLRYFVSRCWAEGISKAAVARLTRSRAALTTERAYVLRTLPRGVRRGARDALLGDVHGLLRALAIVMGVAVTSSGYACGRLAGARVDPEPRAAQSAVTSSS